MSALKAGPAAPAWLAAGLIGLAIGGAGGFYAASWHGGRPAEISGNTPGPPGGPPAGLAGGGPGGGAADHPQAAALIRAVGALSTLEKARGQDLSDEQRRKLAAAAASLKTDAALTESECEAKLAELTAVLSEPQRALLEEMGPRGRGGRGGGGGPGGPGGASNGPGRAVAAAAAGNGPGGTAPMPLATGFGGGMGGPPQIDYEHPFKEGRPRERLEELLTLLGR